MDPTQTLAEIRELSQHEDPAEIADALTERIEALDLWMSKGGFPPEQWVIKTPKGRPRRTTDGVIRDDVVHGTRRGYNKGCKCIPCTEANRNAATARRIAKQMEEKNHASSTPAAGSDHG